MKKAILLMVMLFLPTLFFRTGLLSAASVDDLINAVWGMDIQGVTEALENGADINAKNSQGTTALLLACSYKDNDEMIKLLVNRGADVNLKGGNGSIPLCFAARYSLKATQLLIENGADVNAKGTHGTTALMLASRAGNTSIVKFLLSNGADADMENDHGQTALKWAASADKQEVIDILKGNGIEK